jgi:hypothetical protein
MREKLSEKTGKRWWRTNCLTHPLGRLSDFQGPPEGRGRVRQEGQNSNGKRQVAYFSLFLKSTGFEEEALQAQARSMFENWLEACAYS